MTDTFHDRLHRAADDTERPLTTDIDHLLTRARVGRRRHRLRLTGAVVFTAAAMVGTTFGVRAALPDGARPVADHRAEANDEGASAAAPLSDDETIRRCLPQLAKYDAYPQFSSTSKHSAAKWRLPRDRSYAPGDVVALQDREANLNPVLCIVPEQGHEQDPVPFSDLQPGAADSERIAEVCSELYLPQARVDATTMKITGHSDEKMPELRGADVLAVDSEGPVVEALLSKDGTFYECALRPITWDAGPDGISPTAEDGFDLWTQGAAVGPQGKSATTDENANFYFGAGVLPEEAASIEFTLESGATFEVPVQNGRYAFVHKEQGTSGVEEHDYRVLDRSGEVLHEGTSRR